MLSPPSVNRSTVISARGWLRRPVSDRMARLGAFSSTPVLREDNDDDDDDDDDDTTSAVADGVGRSGAGDADAAISTGGSNSCSSVRLWPSTTAQANGTSCESRML